MMMRTMACILTGIVFLASSTVNASLVAEYNFDGNALDTSGNELHGTTYGGVSLTTDRDNNSDSAYWFDGSNDYIAVGASPLLDFGIGDFTLSVWIQVDNFGGNMPILTRFDGAHTAWDMRLGENGNNPNHIYTHHDDSHGWNLWPISLQGGRWYHLAWRRQEGQYEQVFLNGVPTPVQVNGRTASGAGTLGIGKFCSWHNFPYHFSGKIDNISIYNHALTDQQIEIAAGVPEPSPLILLGIAAISLLAYAGYHCGLSSNARLGIMDSSGI